VVVSDIEVDEEYAPYRAAAREAGFRSVMTTPLLTQQNVLIGAVSTHFVNVHAPTAIEIETLRLYSVAAADQLYQLLGDDSLEVKALSMSRRLYDEAEATSERLGSPYHYGRSLTAPAVTHEAGEEDWGR
jgi:GAF domain-containing protein